MTRSRSASPAGFSISANPTVTLTGAGYTGCLHEPGHCHHEHERQHRRADPHDHAHRHVRPERGTVGCAHDRRHHQPDLRDDALANWTVATSASVTPASPAGNITIAAATAPTAVTFAGAPQVGLARATWTVGYTATTAC